MKLYVGETVTFKIGRHVKEGIVSMVDASRQRLFVKVAQDVHELVYEDEVVR